MQFMVKFNFNLFQAYFISKIFIFVEQKKKSDLEAGGYPLPPQNTRYIISARVRPYYSLMFILMLVLLVTTSLLGIFGTEYLYEQYRYLVGNEVSFHSYLNNTNRF